MSRRLLTALLAAGALVAPPDAVSQEAPTTPTEADLLRQIDSLAPLVADAQEKFARITERREDVRRTSVPTTTDSVVIGQVHIVTPAGQGELANELFREVLAESFAGLEDHPGMNDGGRWFSFQRSTPHVPLYVAQPHPFRAHVGSLTSREGTKREIANALRSAIFGQLVHQKSALWGWGVTGGINPEPKADERLYREVATAVSHLAPECIEGQAMSCWTLLGLDVERVDQAETWYEPHERVALVSGRRLWNWGGREVTATYETCLDGAVNVCDRLIRETLEENDNFRIDPLRAEARTLMASIALDAGGAGAWARLLEDPSRTPAEALRYASGLSSEELATRWHEAVISARPEVHAGLGSIQLFTALWVLLLTGLTMRSTRWRLG